MYRRIVLAALAVSFTAGCSSSPSGSSGSGTGTGSAGTTGSNASTGTSGSGTSATYTYWADVAPILAAKCITCHQQGGIAPFPLLTYQDALAVKDEIPPALNREQAHALGLEAMPPWPPGPGCNTYQHDRSLTDAQIAVLDGWVQQGAPEGGPAGGPLQPPDAGPLLQHVDLTLSTPQPYLPQLSPDDYHCFVVPWPGQAPEYVTGFTVRPGNSKIVHHVIAYLADPSHAAEFTSIDGGGTGGYTCFGGPGNDEDTTWLAAWAPGAAGGDFPTGTGIRVDPGSVVILQVHYNVLNGPGESDQTQVDLELADSVQKQAAVVPYADPSWLSSGGMPIAAGDPDATASISADITPYMGYVTNNVIPANAPFTIYTVGAHMHLRGRHQHMEIERAGGGSTCLLDVPDWDFHWQGSYSFSQPVVFNPGDQLEMDCHWDNSAANQPYYPDGGQIPPRDLQWGDGTQDEMCLGLLYVTP